MQQHSTDKNVEGTFLNLIYRK